MKGAASIFLAVLAVLAVAAIAQYSSGGGTLFSSLGGGVSTLSVSQVDYISNDATVGGKAWLITAVANSGGQSAVGYFTKDKIKDVADGVSSQYDFDVTMNINKEECAYSIMKTNEKIKHVNYKFWDEWANAGYLCTDGGVRYNECLNTAGNFKFARKGFQCACIFSTDSATYGTLQTPALAWAGEIIAHKGTENYVAGLSSATQNAVWVADKIYAAWQGSLTSGETCPVSSDSKVTAAYYQGSWRTINDIAFNDYRNYANGGFDACLNIWTSSSGGGDTLDTCTIRWNYYEMGAVSGKTFMNGLVSGDANNGKVVVGLDRMIQFPVMTFKVKAEWIGIVANVGKPKITSVSSSDFTTGDNGYVVVKVRNDGEATGSFGLYTTCGNGFSASGSTTFFTEAKGEEMTFNLPITATCSQNTGGSCSVVAFDRNNPNVKDTQDVNVNCKPILTCTAGAKRCNGVYIQQCDSYGTKWVNTLECEQRCEIQNSEPVCVVDSGEACAWWDVPCKLSAWFNSIRDSVTMIVIGMLLIIAVIIFSKRR